MTFDAFNNDMLFARALALVHALIVATTVAGGVAIFTGRFRQFRGDDYFA